MAITTGTVVRTAVVLGAVGYCAWRGDAASAPAPSGPGAAKLPAVANSVLTPAILPPPSRNPFRTADAQSVASTAAGGAAASRSKSRSGPSGSRGKSADGTGSGRKAGKRPADPFASLRLNATSICGGQRMAMINGRLYLPGASLAGSSRAAGTMVVEQILPYKVLLRGENRVIELGYHD